MTQEEKDLLLKDMCARIQYGLKATTKSSCWTGVYDVEGYKNNRIYLDCPVYDEGDDEWLVEFVKPYLRPLSSMTEDEKNELFQLMGNGTDIQRVDFYNAHHFDYRGLIPMGLALEAPEGMYKQ